MSTFLTRLRSLRRSKPTSTPAVSSIDTNTARPPHGERDAQASVDGSPDSPSHIAELDSKIYPDLSALFASVEDALKNVERVAEVKKREPLSDDTESENDYSEERVRPENQTGNGTIYASYGSGLDTGWSTFGQDDTPCPTAPRRTHIGNNQGEAISANFSPSSADAILSWSPKQIESSEAPGLSCLSYSSPALYPSPEVQHQFATQSSVYYSPSLGTFGRPSPCPFPFTDSPSFPPPAFHSTPKTSSLRSQSGRRRSQKNSTRRPPSVSSPPPHLPSKIPRMKRTELNLSVSAKRTASVPTIEAPERKQFPIRTSSSVSRAINRRRSAEWNAHAASAGVVADPRETTEFGWPAEVSREILRLSLGDEMMLYGQGAPSSAAIPSLRKERAESGNLKRGGPRVSHAHKFDGRLIRSSVSEQDPSSAHLYSTTLPPSSSTSSAPGRSDRPQTTATQPERTPHASGVAAQKTAKSRSQPSGDNALDAKSDSKMGAAGHKRSESENGIDWQSAELQEFISRKGSGGNLSGDVLRPSTPMKKSESESTYQTAGSSSYLHAPSLSVIAPTPRSSPGASRPSSGASPEEADGLLVPTSLSQAVKSKGKRKAEESEDVSPPDARGSQSKKASLVAEEPRRNSNASRAPSSFQSSQSQKSNKRVRLSSPMATPDISRPGSTVPQHLGSVSSRGSSRSNVTPSHSQRHDSKSSPLRSVSRASRISRAMSTAASGGSSVAFPHRRSLSQTSIPISAIITPRAPSVERLSTFHMRDPRRPLPQREVGWTLRFSSYDDKGSPFMAWAFWSGFLFPLLWWLASFWRIPKTRMVGMDTEKAVIVDDPFYEREARVWRVRCRIASVLFFVTYAPVIILLAIFV